MAGAQSSPARRATVVAFGLATTIAVGAALGAVELYTGFALYSFVFFFVIPVGAILAGFAAASGYYFGLTLLNDKPVGNVVVNMVLAAVSAYLAAHYVPYFVLEIDGILVREFISFPEYLDISIRSASMSFGVRGHAIGETGEMRPLWGYLYAALQVGGFAAGGFAVFGFLLGRPYCEGCGKYFRKLGKQARYTSDADVLVANIRQLAELFVSSRGAEAMTFHSTHMGEAKLGKNVVGSQIVL
jgi:hypothetical protein